jgi:hypothetical protein
MHTWIAVEPTDAPLYTRYEVLGFGVANGAPAVRIDRMGREFCQNCFTSWIALVVLTPRQCRRHHSRAGAARQHAAQPAILADQAYDARAFRQRLAERGALVA